MSMKKGIITNSRAELKKRTGLDDPSAFCLIRKSLRWAERLVEQEQIQAWI